MMHASKRGRRVQRAQVNLKKQTKKTLPLQRWQITRARGGYFYIGVKGKRLRLTAIGDRVDLGPARRGDAQLWAFVPANFTDYFIVSKATGKAIDFRSPTSTKIKLSGGFKRPFKVTPLSNLKAGHFLARLRVLTHNIYGKSPLKCKFRARRLGKWIANQKPAYDFIGLQEYYESKKLDPITCSGKYFHKEVTRTGQFKSKAQFYRYRPRRRAATNGGLALLTPHKIITKREYNWGRQDGVVGKLAALEGVIFARVQAAPKVQIDFYVLHLWSGTPRVEERRSQLRRLAKIIHKNSYGGGRKGQNPVVVMGDFNIGGPPCHKQKNGKRVICGNPGHDDIVTLHRNPRDIWLEFNPGKEGLTNDGRKNRVDADEEPGWGRIDYIFVLEDPYFSQSPLMIRDVSTSVIPVSVVKVKTEKRFNVGSHSFTGNFDCPEKFKTCKMAGKSCCPDRQLEVSDHYGIEAFLDIFRRQK